MRALTLAGALTLAACGGNEPANNSAVGADSGAEEIGSANDATAIDAATGESADMAADVDYTFNEDELNGVDSNSESDAADPNNGL